MAEGVSFKVKFDDADARRAIRTLALKAASLREPLSDIGEALLTSTHERFRQEVSPEGKPWKALTPRYVNRPRKRGGRGGRAHPILFRRGNLFRSLIYQASDTELRLGTNQKFPGGASAGAIHQFGGKSNMAPGPAAIPARPFLGISTDDEKTIGSILADYLALQS
ncbi:MAG: phage virion morphogenesis protein [Terriglobia bacterium]